MRETAESEGSQSGQNELHARLVRAIATALSLAEESDAAVQAASGAYRSVAEILVALRHQFMTRDGQTPDLRGRSTGYRNIVRDAYAQAGAMRDRPIEKRLTAGVAYWVRKLLIERYGEPRLREMGVLRRSSGRSALRGSPLASSPGDPAQCLAGVVELLNILATDPSFEPREHMVRSAVRAVVLLQRKLPPAEAGRHHMTA